MTDPANVWAVIPAAGLGGRFAAGMMAKPKQESGSPFKQLHHLDGRSILAALIDTLEASRLAGVTIVVNPAIANAMRAERPESSRRRYALNDHPESQMLESVRIGLQHLGDVASGGRGGSTGVLIVPGDHPFLKPEAINVCLGAFEAGPDRIVVATHGGQRGHPMILPADLAAAVREGTFCEPLNRLRERYAGRVRFVEVADPGVLRDVDTPADLRD